MPEESYEMTRSTSSSIDPLTEQENEEEAHLLNKQNESDSESDQELDEDGEWAIIVEESATAGETEPIYTKVQ
jgi:hypothetical protein